MTGRKRAQSVEQAPPQHQAEDELAAPCWDFLASSAAHHAAMAAFFARCCAFFDGGGSGMSTPKRLKMLFQFHSGIACHTS